MARITTTSNVLQLCEIQLSIGIAEWGTFHSSIIHPVELVLLATRFRSVSIFEKEAAVAEVSFSGSRVAAT